MKGRGKRKLGVKPNEEARAVSDRHRKKMSLILSMISTSQKIGTEKRGRGVLLRLIALVLPREGEKRKMRRKRSEKEG